MDVKCHPKRSGLVLCPGGVSLGVLVANRIRKLNKLQASCTPGAAAYLARQRLTLITQSRLSPSTICRNSVCFLKRIHFLSLGDGGKPMRRTRSRKPGDERM